MMRRSLVCFSIFLLSAFIWSGGTLRAAAAKGSQAAGPKNAVATENPARPEDFAGSEACASCHGDLAKGLASNPHSKLALEHGGQGVTCEGCHGPGKAHIDGGGDVTKIFRFTKATPKETDSKCLGCHEGKHPNFDRSAHGEANVSCLGCHSIHQSGQPLHLLKVSQPTLCYSCHSDIKPEFSKPFHHKVDEGVIGCSDCHDPHGSFQKKGLKTAAQNDQVCVKCHSETAGPFVFEHPPVKAEGCSTCHSPHGSPNARLLTRSNVNTLCIQCHATPSGPAHNQATQYQACTVCHTQVHGSNASFVFFK
jgi:DmsE family decaheme c-type cytochrome